MSQCHRHHQFGEKPFGSGRTEGYLFWICDDGDNWLKGVDGDVNNPPRLEPEMIQSILVAIPEARESYNYWFPKMLPKEQERLNQIVQGAAQFIEEDPQTISDNFMKTLNTMGVHTCGPRGGGN
jgi:hypothetical protein